MSHSICSSSLGRELRSPVCASQASKRQVAACGTARPAGQKFNRRTVSLLIALPALLSIKPAYAEDVKDAKGAAAERKAELRQTAQEVKRTGKDLSVFPESGFAENEATTRGGKSEGPSSKPRQEDSIQPSPFSAPK